MEIRPARLQDLPGAVHLWQERIAVLQQSDTMYAHLPRSPLIWRRQAQAWLDDDETAFFVATVEGELVGFIVAVASDGLTGLVPKRVGRVLEVAVDLHRSHSGLGGALLERARRWFSQCGIDVMTIDVPAYYPVEQAFWRSQGGKQLFIQYWLAT